MQTKQKNLWFSYLLVAVQFIFLGLIVFYQTEKPKMSISYILMGASLLIVIWAFAAMRIKNVQAIPNPKEGAKLITRGPYRLIRHPMYLSLFLLVIPFMIEHFIPLRAVFGGIFLTNMVIKLLYEESLLKVKYPGYKDYMKKTYRIIPYIF